MDLFEKQVEQVLYPSTNPRSKSARDDYVISQFWAYFNPTHDDYRPAIADFEKAPESWPNIATDWRLELEGLDNSDSGSPFVDVVELEQRRKERRDEFWSRAGFIAKGRDTPEQSESMK